MKRKLTKVFVCLLGACILFAAAGCGSSFDPAALVQGNLDAIYKGVASDEYLEMLDDGTTKEDVENDYIAGLEAEAEFFADVFLVEILTDESKAKIVDMYKEIYQHAKYTVGEASSSGDNYQVPVTVYPIDIFANITDADLETLMNDLMARDEKGEFADFTDEQLEDEWVNSLIAFITPKIATIDYQDSAAINVSIIKDDDDFYSISNDSIDSIDSYIIAY